MFWEVFLQCPRCSKRHLLVELGFNPQGDLDLSVECCDSRIGTRMTWEDAVAGALRQEEKYLAEHDPKRLEKNWKHEN